MIKVLLLGSEDYCYQIANILQKDDFQIVSAVSNENMLLDEIDRTTPDLVLVTEINAMTLRSCHQIYLLRPRAVPIVIGDSGDSALIKTLMDAGVHYVISNDIEPFEFIAELKSIYTNESSRIVSLENTGLNSSKSKVIMLMSMKEGVGKTTFATSLAVKLAQNGNRVVVLDYDLQFGDVDTYFGVNATSSIAELVAEQTNPSVDTIRQCLALHVSGVNFLAAPFTPEDSEAISASQAEQILSALRVYYDYVIIDAAAGFNDINAVCMECASNVFVLSGSDIPGIRATKKGLTVMKAFAEEEKLELIVGRNRRLSLKKEEIERAVGMTVSFLLPENEKVAMAASNQGIPVALSNPASDLAGVIGDVADVMDGKDITKKKFQITRDSEKKEKKKRFFSGFGKKGKAK